MCIFNFSYLEDNKFYKYIKYHKSTFIIKLIKILMVYKKIFGNQNKMDEIKHQIMSLKSNINNDLGISSKDEIELDIKFDNLYSENKPIKFKKAFYKTAKKILSKRSINNPLEICQLKISNLFPKNIDDNFNIKNKYMNDAFGILCNIFDLDLSCDTVISYDIKNRTVEISFYPTSKIHLEISKNDNYFDLCFDINCKVLMNEYETDCFQNNLDYPNYKEFINEIKKAIRSYKLHIKSIQKNMNKI